MTLLKKILELNRPNNTYGSNTTYESAIKKTCERLNIPLNLNDIINNYQVIIAHALQYPDRMKRKNIITPFITLLDFPVKTTLIKNALQALRKVLSETIKEIEEEHIDGSLTEYQKRGWVTMDEVQTAYSKLKQEVEPLFFQNAVLKFEDLQKCQLFVLLSCLILIPPRRTSDYVDFKIRNINKDEDNYMEGNKFVFNKYKTAKTYGTHEEDIPYELRRIINIWKSINTSEWLLCSRKGEQLYSSRIVTMLNNFFGKPTSTNILRKTFITDAKERGELNTYRKMKSLAHSMSHSVDMQQTVYLTNVDNNKNVS